MIASEGKNIHIIGVSEGTERARGPESISEQIIAENFPNLGREIGIQIQEIETSPPENQQKPLYTSTFNSEICKFQR